MNLANFINDKLKWSIKTFGPGLRTRGLCQHIKKELNEILESPTDIEEWVDVILLAIDGAGRAGHDGYAIMTALETKQAKNVKRSWPDEWPPQDEAAEHVR